MNSTTNKHGRDPIAPTALSAAPAPPAWHDDGPLPHPRSPPK